MPKLDTRLSGAGYALERVFAFVWRWRALRPYVGATGLAWGRRSAMRAARTFIRSRRERQPFEQGAPAADQKPVVRVPAE